MLRPDRAVRGQALPPLESPRDAPWCLWLELARGSLGRRVHPEQATRKTLGPMSGSRFRNPPLHRAGGAATRLPDKNEGRGQDELALGTCLRCHFFGVPLKFKFTWAPLTGKPRLPTQASPSPPTDVSPLTLPGGSDTARPGVGPDPAGVRLPRKAACPLLRTPVPSPHCPPFP